MLKKTFIGILILSFLFVVVACTVANWGWKKTTAPDDVMAFLNGQGAYTRAVKDARITSTWKGTHPEFNVFYQAGAEGQPAGNWGWKKATDPEDVYNFLNGMGAYGNPVKDALISAMWKDTYPEFYIFYQSGTGVHGTGNWGWKLATDPEDVMNFLNGKVAYTNPVTTARIAAISKESHTEFYVFYQKAGGPTYNWGWKKATDPDDAVNFLNGKGAYQHPVKGFEGCSVNKGSYDEYYIFYY